MAASVAKCEWCGGYHWEANQCRARSDGAKCVACEAHLSRIAELEQTCELYVDRIMELVAKVKSEAVVK